MVKNIIGISLLLGMILCLPRYSTAFTITYNSDGLIRGVTGISGYDVELVDAWQNPDYTDVYSPPYEYPYDSQQLAYALTGYTGYGSTFNFDPTSYLGPHYMEEFVILWTPRETMCSPSTSPCFDGYKYTTSTVVYFDILLLDTRLGEPWDRYRLTDDPHNTSIPPHFYTVWTPAGVTPVPEPSTFLLLGGGLIGLAFVARLRRKE